MEKKGIQLENQYEGEEVVEMNRATSGKGVKRPRVRNVRRRR